MCVDKKSREDMPNDVSMSFGLDVESKNELDHIWSRISALDSDLSSLDPVLFCQYFTSVICSVIKRIFFCYHDFGGSII